MKGKVWGGGSWGQPWAQVQRDGGCPAHQPACLAPPARPAQLQGHRAQCLEGREHRRGVADDIEWLSNLLTHYRASTQQGSRGHRAAEAPFFRGKAAFMTAGIIYKSTAICCILAPACPRTTCSSSLPIPNCFVVLLRCFRQRQTYPKEGCVLQRERCFLAALRKHALIVHQLMCLQFN